MRSCLSLCLRNHKWKRVSDEVSVYQATSVLLWYCKKFKRLSNWLEIYRFLCNLACYQSCEQLIDLSHQTLKACLITMTDRLGTNIVCLEKLPSFSENLDKEIGLFKPLKGVIKTVLLEVEDFFWQFPEQAHKGEFHCQATAHNHEKSCHNTSFLCRNAAKLQTSTKADWKCCHQIFQGECCM